MIRDNADRFARIERMIGQEALDRLHNSFVVVIGLGAVGSYTTEALARAGVGRLRLVDFDEVRLTNINRQLYALDSTVGKLKIEVARTRILDINPQCSVEAVKSFVHAETIEEVLSGKPDLVIDAIDSFSPKVELLTGVMRLGLNVISCMGAALRTDPALIRVGPLSEAKYCPLARQVRKRLRQRKLPVDFKCVYSIEPVMQTAADGELLDEKSEEVFVRGRKRRTLGSLPTLTGIFGLTAANAAIQMLSKGMPISNGK
jgi:tRNA A37 threonylcarbamoyladenosine dehydratase